MSKPKQQRILDREKIRQYAGDIVLGYISHRDYLQSLICEFTIFSPQDVGGMRRRELNKYGNIIRNVARQMAGDLETKTEPDPQLSLFR